MNLHVSQVIINGDFEDHDATVNQNIFPWTSLLAYSLDRDGGAVGPQSV